MKIYKAINLVKKKKTLTFPYDPQLNQLKKKQ